METLFETEMRMPVEPSKDVVRVPLAKPDKCMSDASGLCTTEHHVVHARIPKVGK